MIIFIPIDDIPSWFSRETKTTERGRFHLTRTNLTLYLTDTLNNRVRIFPFLFSMYAWFEQQYGYVTIFAQIVEAE
jgi:hypothetical protein|tara:strand:+ start:1077 stop:1304 length:228 start_codon:yes stop_codon:yes gene_type:complete